MLRARLTMAQTGHQFEPRTGAPGPWFRPEAFRVV